MNNLFYSDKSFHTSGVNHAIISTGTAMINIPRTDYLNFIQAVPESGPNTEAYMTCPVYRIFGTYCYSNMTCDTFKDELKPISIYLSEKTFVIPPEGYLLEDYNNHKCVIAVTWINDQYNMIILGDTFMRNFFTQFNFGKK